MPHAAITFAPQLENASPSAAIALLAAPPSDSKIVLPTLPIIEPALPIAEPIPDIAPPIADVMLDNEPLNAETAFVTDDVLIAGKVSGMLNKNICAVIPAKDIAESAELASTDNGGKDN